MMDSFASRRFVVIGAYAADCIARTNSLPTWDTNTLAESIALAPGGQALNQAVALARVGAEVTALGVVARDPAGAMVLESLQENSVDTRLIRHQEGVSTPICVCVVSDSGRTSFLWRVSDDVAITPEDIHRASGELATADGVLLTYEVPLETARAALSTLRKSHGVVMVQPSPPLTGAHLLSYDSVNVLLPNQIEAAELLNAYGTAIPSDSSDLPKLLHKATGVPEIIVTCGEDGCFSFTGDTVSHHPAHPVPEVVDTMGASDAFAAHFVASTVAGAPTEQAIENALAAAAYSIQRPGGCASMPPAGYSQ